MSNRLIFQTEVANTIVSFYDENKTSEKIVILVIKKTAENFQVIKILIPSVDDYRIISNQSVSLNPSYLLNTIQICIQKGYDGFILMHNHTNGIALFSRDDRIANKKLLHFFAANKIPLIAGSAVYANRRVTYTTNNKSLKHRLCISIYSQGAR